VVVLLFEPNLLSTSVLQKTEVLWIDLVQDIMLGCFCWGFCIAPGSGTQSPQVRIQLHRPDRSQSCVVLLCAAGSQRIAAVSIQVWSHFAGVQAAEIYR